MDLTLAFWKNSQKLKNYHMLRVTKKLIRFWLSITKLSCARNMDAQKSDAPNAYPRILES